MNRLGLKITCLVAAVVIWVLVASNSPVEQVARLPLRVEGLEGLTMAGSDIPEKVKVRLEGSKLRLFMHRYFNRYVGEVRINLEGYGPGKPFHMELDGSQVYTDLRFVGIANTEDIVIHIDTIEVRKLPVVVMTTGNLPESVGFLVPVRSSPDSVTISGPSRKFPDEPFVRTVPVDLSRIQESVSVEVDLISPEELLNLSQRQVGLTLLVAEVEERTLANIPVIPFVDTGQPDAAVSPPVADVMVRGVADSIRALTGDRISITISTTGLSVGEHTLGCQVIQPEWATLLGTDPVEFQVIIGNPAQGFVEPPVEAVDGGAGG